jgi:hypothetical protein
MNKESYKGKDGGGREEKQRRIKDQRGNPTENTTWEDEIEKRALNRIQSLNLSDARVQIILTSFISFLSLFN